ncbi:hypothetical protein NMY22_g9293 [Coprinellus aureogranulatus]|nr:hypothetical protein NMY22_g9293 [Coprinellus aureogranulatus]
MKHLTTRILLATLLVITAYALPTPFAGHSVRLGRREVFEVQSISEPDIIATGQGSRIDESCIPSWVAATGDKDLSGTVTDKAFMCRCQRVRIATSIVILGKVMLSVQQGREFAVRENCAPSPMRSIPRIPLARRFEMSGERWELGDWVYA